VTEDLDPRRKRIIWRATHRGIREMDIVVGTFVKQRIARLTRQIWPNLNAFWKYLIRT
jgi:succinate dehydrogenase flavin-adding protein (antitoxin of CptAB toxin-antitoxin module)